MLVNVPVGEMAVGTNCNLRARENVSALVNDRLKLLHPAPIEYAASLRFGGILQDTNLGVVGQTLRQVEKNLGSITRQWSRCDPVIAVLREGYAQTVGKISERLHGLDDLCLLAAVGK